MVDALILFSVVALVVFVIAPFLVTMCCLATFRIVKTIIIKYHTGQVVQDEHRGLDQGHVNLAMELDVNDLQPVQPQRRTSIGLLGSLRSSLGHNNVLEVALEEVLVHHDELSKAYEGEDLIAEQQMKKTNALGSSLGSKNLTMALKQVFKINNEIDAQQMLGSTWPQPKGIKK